MTQITQRANAHVRKHLRQQINQNKLNRRTFKTLDMLDLNCYTLAHTRTYANMQARTHNDKQTNKITRSHTITQ